MLFQRRIRSRDGLVASGSIGRLNVPALLLGAFALAGSSTALSADLTYPGTTGIGVKGTDLEGTDPGWDGQLEINHSQRTCKSQALSFDLGGAASEATVNFEAFDIASEGERGNWEAYDIDGQSIGSAEFATSQTTINITGINFRYLVFTAIPLTGKTCPDADPNSTDSSDYYIKDISYTVDGAVKSVPAGVTSNWASLDPAGFDFNEPYASDGRLIDAKIVINTEKCDGGTGTNNDSCTVQFTTDFQLKVTNASDVEGSLIPNIKTFVDPREECNTESAENVGNPQSLEIDTSDRSLNLGYLLGTDSSGKDIKGPIIPGHLCGTPDPANAYVPTFHLLDIDSDLTVKSSVLEFISDNSFNGDYFCNATDLERRPVIGWLPKTASHPNNSEIPVLTSAYALVPYLQDITYACDSSRSGSSRLSYVVWDLHHKIIDDNKYHTITKDAITQLYATIEQTDLCVRNVKNKAVLSRVKSATSAFDTYRYSVAKRQLISLLSTVSSGVPYDQCYFNLDWDTNTQPVINGPADGAIPRNFRGDLIVQIKHILYMIERMLGETKPANPAF